jgi:hypothetical protein
VKETNQKGFGTDSNFQFSIEPNVCQCDISSHDNVYSEAVMPVYTINEKICLAHPAKNHVADICGNSNEFIPDHGMNITMSSTPDTDMFDINIEHDAGKHIQGQNDYLGYQNCPKFCEDNDKALCTLCFTVPNITKGSGIYSFKWTWEFNQGEFYTTCWDAKILTDTQTNIPTVHTSQSNSGPCIINVPTTTNIQPITTTIQPTITTLLPTTEPITTTIQPTITTLLPTTEPITTTIQPTTIQPTTIQPTTTAPITTTIQPTTTEPITTTIQPTTIQPTTTAPITTTIQPTTTTLLPTTEPTTAPITTTIQPTTPNNPTPSVTTTEPTTAPITTTIQPTIPNNPTPSVTTTEPTTAPITTTIQPTITTLLPTTEPTTIPNNPTPSVTTIGPTKMNITIEVPSFVPGLNLTDEQILIDFICGPSP